MKIVFQKHYEIGFLRVSFFVQQLKNWFTNGNLVCHQKMHLLQQCFLSSKTTIFVKESGFWKNAAFVPVLGGNTNWTKSVHTVSFTTLTGQKTKQKPRNHYWSAGIWVSLQSNKH